ncbi:dna repair protein complementing xp-g cells-related [Holotrichia oblita]|uniref:Dna repair protein complementing xp-g cells-related n=1 Tax=Holotrichia oblita TaxID=644536 RepID=A0ACB9TCF9_HOLOL|nr:dna repair protein complementing xp-g cells-related [Holotrichia oblita]
MGVQGLWRLIEPSGKPVPLETLENKEKRNQSKSKNLNDANRIQKQLLNSLLKHSAINAVLSDKAKAALENDLEKLSQRDVNKDARGDMFVLPQSQNEVIDNESDEDSSSSDEDHSHLTRHWDLHTIDEKSAQFKSLPVNIRHEILSDLKETRKQSSWGRIHELPTQSDDFSGYQMKRLLKRYSVQVSLEETEKEMGGCTLSLGELEKLLTNHGVITSESVVGRRIASDENKRYIYIKNLKEAIEQAVDQAKNETGESINKDGINEDIPPETTSDSKIIKSKADIEFEGDLEQAIKLSLQNKEESFNSKEVDVEKCSDEGNKSQEEGKEIIAQETSENVNELNLEPHSKQITSENICNSSKSKADEEYEQDLEAAIKLSLQDEVLSNKSGDIIDKIVLDGEEDRFSDSSGHQSDSELADNVMASAKSYMLEYSGLTPAEIVKIIGCKSGLAKAKINTDNGEKSTKIVANKKIDFKKLLNKPSSSDKLRSSEENCDLKQLETDSNSSTTKQDIKDNSVEFMSDTDSDDDFLEVETSRDTSQREKEPQTCEKNKNSLQITIEKVSALEDDIFKDVFAETDTLKDNSAEETLNTENKKSQNDTSSDNCNETNKVKRINIIENIILSPNVKDDIPKESELLKDIVKPSTSTDTQKPKLTTNELKKIRDNLAKETTKLMSDKSNKERLAGNITDQMYQEAQELLQLFGVPYVIAPMEAEAQCAFLNEINLTDGTITDDSDIWLFGGKTVYKNFFNQSKLVLEFKAEDIQDSFKLSRYEMILLALLVGSDYTTGLQGVGPVTALEILATFPPPKNEMSLNHIKLLTGLREFRRWFNNNKSGKSNRMGLRSKLRNVEISEQFPSLQVVQAYLQPAVETSKESFSWQKPDAVSLIEFARHKFGWNQTKSEEILKPVLRKLEDTTTQSKITNYFKTKHKIQGNLPLDKVSKRVKRAVTKMGDDPSEDPDEIPPPKSTDKGKEKKRKGRKKKEEQVNEEKPENMVVDEDIAQLQQTQKLSRNKVREMKIAMNEMLLKAEKEAQAPVPSVSQGSHLHRKETIPQKEKDKADLLRNKLKAVEVFRKSKQGPGFIKKRQKNVRQPKEDAELSESSD